MFNDRIMQANLLFCYFPPQDPAGIFELVELVGNGTYGQVYKVNKCCTISKIQYDMVDWVDKACLAFLSAVCVSVFSQRSALTC